MSASFSNPDRIGDKELEHVKAFHWLRHLDPRFTKVTDNGLEHLMGLKHLQDLFLEGTKVTDDGIRKLKQALPNCEIYR